MYSEQIVVLRKNVTGNYLCMKSTGSGVLKKVIFRDRNLWNYSACPVGYVIVYSEGLPSAHRQLLVLMDEYSYH